MTQIWLDYSGARPDPNDIKRNGVTGVIRYLSEPIPITAWKRITGPEKDAILAAGLDLILNYEWYEGRMLEGAAAGAHDGSVALAQASELGYPKGASIYFSHDTSARNDAAVLAYMQAAQTALGDNYRADIYSGIDVVDLCVHAGVATFGWQTIAWSQGRIGMAHMYQNGKQWYSGGCDENVILHEGNGSWLSHGVAPIPAPIPTPVPAPAPVPAPPAGNTYTVRSGDTLTGIANQFGASIEQLMAWNPVIKNANLIQVGWVLVVHGSVAPAPVPAPASAPVGNGSYVVQSGDNLTVIAQRFHTTVTEIVALNPSLARNPNLIYVGQVLTVPGGAPPAPVAPPAVQQYRVVSGDNLSAIAGRFGTSVAQLMAWNPVIRNANLIQVGWVLRVR